MSIPSRVPKLIVFDLDMCMWSPEMYELSGQPDTPMEGSLGTDIGRGVVGAKVRSASPGRSRSEFQTVTLFPGALLALQECFTNEKFQHTKLAAASSSEEPSYSAACLDMLEILPGIKMREAFSYFAIGRTKACGNLTSDKTTHFAKIKKESQVEFEEMLFFDDCNWGDHVERIHQAHGVIGQKTPNGLTEKEWRDALEKFSKARDL